MGKRKLLDRYEWLRNDSAWWTPLSIKLRKQRKSERSLCLIIEYETIGQKNRYKNVEETLNWNLGGLQKEMYRNVNMQSFKDTKIYFMDNMNEYWSEKKKFLSNKQIKLINKIVYEMTDEEGEKWFSKRFHKYQCDRIDNAFCKCYNKVIRFKRRENMIEQYIKSGEKLPRGI